MLKVVQKKRGNKKGFSLIELIVVIAIIGVLVMLATPKFLGYVERAELKRIQHDVKVMEGKMEEGMVHDMEEFLSWDDNIKDLRLLVVAKQLFDTEGVARKVDKLSSTRFGRTASLEGVPSMLSHTEGEHRDYKVIPTSMKKHIKSSLPGTFYSNINGKVYYEHNKPLKSAEEEIVLRCEAPKPLDYTFDHLTGTIIKYHGNLQHLIIPAAFEVDGVCWPVRIIGKGAFQIGNYTGPEEEQPIKSVVIPPSVEIIEEDAFKGNELENVEISPSVEEIEKDAFKDNKIPNKPEEGSGGPGGAVIKKEPEDIEIDGSAFDNNGHNGDENIEPSFEPSTDKDLDITIDKDGKISDYDGDDTVIIIPPTIIVNGEKVPVTEIEDGAFQGKGLITVGLPFGLERIEDYAFAGNQLIATIIPETVVHIGNYAFAFNEVSHTKNSKITKATIRNIDIQKDEYVNSLDKKGDIVESGKKLDIIKSITKLLDHIFLTSKDNLQIDVGNGVEGDVNSDSGSTNNGFADERIQVLIDSGYIPIATSSDLDAIRSANTRMFGKGTKWEKEHSGGFNKKYIQVTNIDMSNIDNFEPLGNERSVFRGTYDGGRFEVRNLTIDKRADNYIGLFGRASEATLENIGLVDVDVKGRLNTGGLAGYVLGTVRNSYVTGTVVGSSKTGLLVGHINGGNGTGRIQNSYTKGNVSGGAETGGLVGINNNSIISNSYSMAHVSGSDAGGLAGRNYHSNIINSYAVASINSRANGLIGTTGNARVSNSYYNKDMFMDSVATGLTTEEMKTENSYKDWDFGSVWTIKTGQYPTLQWQD